MPHARIVTMSLSEFLKPTFVLDSDHPKVRARAEEITKGKRTDIEKAVALYDRVRDDYAYDPFRIDLRLKSLPASLSLEKKTGYCVGKAILYTAFCRAVGLPSRLQFFIVRNHLGTGRLEKAYGTDLIVFHGGSQVHVGGKWLKVVPAFDKEICKRLGVTPLEFDGKQDSIFQEYVDEAGTKKFMEYVHDYGTFADFPAELAMQELRKYYPSAFDRSVPIEKRVAFLDWD